MGNVLTEEKKQQILALGRLGWSLRRIQQATRVRRETISGYLKAAGITVWRLGGWSRQGRPKLIGHASDHRVNARTARAEPQHHLPWSIRLRELGTV